MEKKLTVPEEAEQRAPEAIGFKPLYAQVRERLMRRLVDGEWSPGMLLPSEIELARQLSVSQGTVRKALDSMTADNLLLGAARAPRHPTSAEARGECRNPVPVSFRLSSGYRKAPKLPRYPRF